MSTLHGRPPIATSPKPMFPFFIGAAALLGGFTLWRSKKNKVRSVHQVTPNTTIVRHDK